MTEFEEVTAIRYATDRMHRFSFHNAPIRGQWVRLEAVLAELHQRQAYPPGVANLLSEMLAAVAMVSEGIQFDGAVSLQSRSAGPLTTVLAECREHNLLRGIARWPEDSQPPAAQSLQALLSGGRLAITMTRPPARDDEQPFSYQGLIELTGETLASNLESYFANSEQLPTHLFFARGPQAGSGTMTGLLLQRLPSSDQATDLELEEDDRHWIDVQRRAAALDHDKLASLSPEQFLRQTFLDHTIALYPPRQLSFNCSCSRARSSSTLRSLPKAEIVSLLEERGSITVTCEICGASYEYQPVDIHLLLDEGGRTVH
jgi:molecular chaperone Hsp33